MIYEVAGHDYHAADLAKMIGLTEDEFRKKAQLALLFDWIQTPPRKTTAGVVYVLRGPELSKIGCTVSINDRRFAIGTSAPFPVFVAHTIQSDNMERLEQMLHAVFHAAGKWQYNEWFRLSEQHIQIIKELGSVVNSDKIDAAFSTVRRRLPEMMSSLESEAIP